MALQLLHLHPCQSLQLLALLLVLLLQLVLHLLAVSLVLLLMVLQGCWHQLCQLQQAAAAVQARLHPAPPGLA